MAKYTLVVFSKSIEDQDDEYNDWYDNVHLKDVLDVPGFVSAKRFNLTPGVGTEGGSPYLSIYEIDAEDPLAVMRELSSRAGTDKMFVSESLDRENTTHYLYKAR